MRVSSSRTVETAAAAAVRIRLTVSAISAGVTHDGGIDLPPHHLDEGGGLDADDLDVVFQQDLMPGDALGLGKDAVPREKGDIFGRDEAVERLDGRGDDGQAPPPGLLNPRSE